jgi:hypothetical protein
MTQENTKRTKVCRPELIGPKPYPSHKGYTVYATYMLQEILDLIPNEPNDSLRADHLPFRPKVASPRLVNLKIHKPICVGSCGRVGYLWRLESNGGLPHLNLYAQDGVMMTKDHIIAKSKGGPDSLLNYQVMCSICNRKKGSD